MVAYEIDVVYTANDGKEEEFTHVVNTTDRDDDAVALTREYFDEFVKGKTKWFRHDVPDREYQKWSHVLYPDPDSLEKIRDWQAQGMKNVLKKDEDGWNISFSRPVSKVYGGNVTTFQPPLVVDAEGKPLRNVSIGNGSDVTTKLEIYSHKTPGGGKAIAARWESTRIDNLVPYEGTRDFDEGDALQAKNLMEQPAPLF
jgi:hypothetical protein